MGASARKQALSAIRLWAPSRSANKPLRRIERKCLRLADKEDFRRVVSEDEPPTSAELRRDDLEDRFAMYEELEDYWWDWPEERLDGCDLPDCPVCFAADKFLCAEDAEPLWRARRLEVRP